MCVEETLLIAAFSFKYNNIYLTKALIKKKDLKLDKKYNQQQKFQTEHLPEFLEIHYTNGLQMENTLNEQCGELSLHSVNSKKYDNIPY